MSITNQPFRILLFATLFIGLAAAFLQGIAAIRMNSSLQSGDQGAYLHLSLAQAEGRALTDGNRHPLYPALLIPLAERSPAFFARARWISLAIGGALLILAALWELKHRNDPVSAVLITLFLGSHVQIVRALSEVWCEPLLFLLLYCLWLTMDTAHSLVERPKGVMRWLLPGLLCGMLYLTKGTGLQVAAAFWVVTLIIRRDWKGTAMGMAVFLIVVSPLLFWNLKTYGSPLYSFASTHNMWFDEADEIWYDDPATLPTLGSYLATHTFSEIAQRLGRGMILEAQMAFQLLWTDWRLPEGSSFSLVLIHFLLKMAVVVLVVVGFWRKTGRGTLTSRMGGWFFLGLVVFLVPSFGWYAQLTNEPRFLMMLVPIGAVLLARAASRGLEWGGDHSNWCGRLVGTAFLGLFLLGTICSFTASGSFAWKTRLLPGPEVMPLAQRVLTEVNQLPENTTVAFGPSHGLPTWLSRGDLKWRPNPWRIDWERFIGFLGREQIRHILLDQETLARRPYLSPLVNPSAPPAPDWRLAFRDRDQDGFFLLWEVQDLTPSPPQP